MTGGLGMAGGRSHPSPPPPGEGIFCWGLVVVVGGGGGAAGRPYGGRGGVLGVYGDFLLPDWGLVWDVLAGLDFGYGVVGEGDYC